MLRKRRDIEPREWFQRKKKWKGGCFNGASRGMTVETPAEISGSGSGINAVVIGSFSPLDTGAEVTLQLASTSENQQELSNKQLLK